MLSDRDICIIRSPTFLLVLENAYRALQHSYVSIESKRALLQFVEFLEILQENISDKDRVLRLDIQLKLKSEASYIPKHDRVIIMQFFENFRKIWHPDGSSTSEADDICNKLQSMNSNNKLKYFLGLVYGSTTHPQFHEVLSKTEAFKWYVNQKKEYISVTGSSDESTFKNIFREEWNKQKVLSVNEFPADKVLDLIYYTWCPDVCIGYL